MDQLIEVLQEIRDGIYAINSNMEDLKKEIMGAGLYNSVSDVCEKLDSVESLLNKVTSYESYGLDDVCSKLDDVCNKLDSIDTNTMT